MAGPDEGARGEFEQRIAQAKLTHRVHVVGPLYGRDKFEALVDAACFCLPSRQEGFSIAITEALACSVPVVISDKGRRHRAYGLYQGDTVARDNYPDRIVIFRDTLLRDFGHDPDELRAQVTRTVRHELAHHLGADELGVRELGL